MVSSIWESAHSGTNDNKSPVAVQAVDTRGRLQKFGAPSGWNNKIA